MKINKLRIKNMYGIEGDKEYDLSTKIVGLFGNNGVGKSSVVNALKFAISGEKTPTTMLCGSPNSAVRIQTDSLTIDRMLTKTETGSQLASWENGVKTPGSRIQVDLANQLNTTKDNLKILSSKDIAASLTENAGKVLLSFVDDELSPEDVKGLLLKELVNDKNIDPQIISSLNFPDHITWKSSEDIAGVYRKKTRELRAEIKGMEAAYNSIRFIDTGETDIPEENVAKEEYDSLVKKEALAVEGRKLIQNYEKLNQNRNTVLKSIQTKKEELDRLSATRDFDALKARKESLIDKGNSLNAQIANANGTLSALQPLYEKMGSGVCPLSCNGIEIKCCTDMTDTKNAVAQQIDDAKKSILKYKQELDTAKEEYERISQELLVAEKKTKLQTEIDSMNQSIPAEMEKPNVSNWTPEEDARKRFLSAVLKNFELKVQQDKLRKQIDEQKRKFYLCDFLTKQFSQKGIVSQSLLGKYISTMTEAAAKAEAETGIRVVFKNEDGLSISYSVNGGIERPYETLSEGEKMLAFLTVSDLLYRIANIPILLLDDVDKLDANNFDHLLTLIERVSDSYQNIIIAGVEHDEFKPILQKHNIPNLLAN